MNDDRYNKLVEEKSKFKVTCKCSCRTSFYPFEHKVKKICRWCGRVMYINDQEKFKDLFLKKKGKIESENR